MGNDQGVKCVYLALPLSTVKRFQFRSMRGWGHSDNHCQQETDQQVLRLRRAEHTNLLPQYKNTIISKST